MYDIDELFAFKKTKYFEGYVLIYYKQKDNEDIVSLEIPSEYGGEPVFAVADHAFKCSDHLAAVFVPDSVVYIGKWAFFCCDSLKYIRLPRRLTKIRDSAFDGCAELEYIDIPDSVRSIGFSAFGLCEKLKKADLPKDLKNLDSHSFFGCKSLESMVIPGKIKRLRWNTFTGCTALEKVEFLNPGTVISYETFNGCEKIPAGIFAESVPSINNYENAVRFLKRYDVLEYMIEKGWHLCGMLEGDAVLAYIIYNDRADMLPLAEKAGWLEDRELVTGAADAAAKNKSAECASWLLVYIHRKFGSAGLDDYEI